MRDLKTNEVIIEKKRFVQEATNHMFLRVDSGEGTLKESRVSQKNFYLNTMLLQFLITIKAFFLKKT